VRVKLAEIARAGAASKQFSLPSTPRSPMPSTKSLPRRAARAHVPASRATSAAADAGAPTVRITPVESGGTAARAKGNRTLMFAGAGIVAVASAIGWFVLSRGAAEPSPASGAAPPTAAPADSTAPQLAAKTAVQPEAPPPAPPAPAPAAAAAAAATSRVVSVGISPAVSDLTVGEKVQLHVVPRDAAGKVVSEKGVRWLSTDARVASVTGNGMVQAVAEGHAVVTASLGGNTASITLNVAPKPPATPAAVAVASVEVIPSTLTVARGSTGQLKAIVHDAAGRVLGDRPVRWVSANPQVADVSTNGLVIGVAPGSTQITAGAEGKSTAVTVTVPALVAAAPAAPPADPRPAVRKLIDAYVAGIQTRNVTRMIAVYPSLPTSTRTLWDNLFDAYPSVSAAIVPGSVDIPASGESAAFDVSMELSNGREHQKILMHFLATPELANGDWHFKDVVQSYVKQ
jgi:hypothetical protein